MKTWKKTVIVDDNTEPRKDCIWVKEGTAYEYDYSERKWNPVDYSGGESGDNSEELWIEGFIVDKNGPLPIAYITYDFGENELGDIVDPKEINGASYFYDNNVSIFALYPEDTVKIDLVSSFNPVFFYFYDGVQTHVATSYDTPSTKIELNNTSYLVFDPDHILNIGV